MKCFPYNLQNKIEKANNKIYPILLYGSEGGLISSLIKETYKQIQKRFGVFDYVNMRNIQADTSMRESISGGSDEESTKVPNRDND